MRAKIGYVRPLGRSAKGGLDLAPAAVLFGIGAARRRAEHSSAAMGKLAKFIYDAAVQRDAAILPVLRVGQHDVSTYQINVAPVQVQGLRHPRSGPE